MRGRAETVRIIAVWADTTRPYSVGQECVEQWWISVFESDTNRELIHSWTQERFLVPMVKLPTTRLCHRGEPLELRLLFSLRIENPLSLSILTNRRDLLAYLIK